MYRRNDLAIFAFCLTTLVPNQLVARDDGRFADSPLKPWFDRLASGKGLCCSFADGFSVQSRLGHSGWALSGTNHYLLLFNASWSRMRSRAVCPASNASRRDP
jgi:hypothetical protein